MNYFLSFFSDKYDLATYIISLIPTLEGRVAIPFAFAFSNLSFFQILLISFLGCITPAFILIPLIRFLKRKITIKKVDFKIEKILKLKNEKEIIKALICFIAIPLPLTGVWSGSLIAGLTDLPIKKSFISIIIGGFISTLIVTIFSYFFGNSVKYLLYFSLALALIFLIIKLLKEILNYKKR